MFTIIDCRRAEAEVDERHQLPACSAQRDDADIVNISAGGAQRRGILATLQAVGCARVTPSAVDRPHRQQLGGRYQVQPNAPEARVIDAPLP